MSERIARLELKRYADGKLTAVQDAVAVEEPMQINLVRETAEGRLQTPVSVTLRTPGHDRELAAGYLFSEGVITAPTEINEIRVYRPEEGRVDLVLKEGVMPAYMPSNRSSFVSSACGLCGKTSLEEFDRMLPFAKRHEKLIIRKSLLLSLQETLRKHQDLFGHTGGIHAAALFDFEGRLISVMEDVGRHNALDKLVGEAFLKNELPLRDKLLLLSGRAGYELIQKSAMAGIPVVAAVGAPSSLAVEAAADQGITLIGFLRDNRFNVYTEFDNFE